MNKKTYRSKSSFERFRVRPTLEALEERVLFAVNAIVAENQLPGNPQSEWDVVGSGPTIPQGFATNISVNQGETVSFKINDQTLALYHIDIYRMGYYAGMGARKVASIPSSQTQRIAQPDPLKDASTGLIDAGNWAVSASWAVPSTATSGIYFARLTLDGSGLASHAFFIVRDDDGHSELLFQTSDTTWQAYNDWGGASFYTGTLGANPSRAYKISYNRPFQTRTSTYGGRDFVFGEEYPMVRWLEANGYDVSYFTGVDADRYGAEILEHQGYLSVGHDEYWSGAQRANVEAARDAGVNLAFFSANEVYWKTRWEPSIDASQTPYRTLVCYKETIAAAKIDPMPNVWTGTWRDPRYRTEGDGGLSENALTGQIFVVNRGPGGELGTSMTVPQADGQMRIWRNTIVASLGPGQVATLGDKVLGYEWDEDRDNAFRPDGLIRLSTTTQAVPQLLDDSYVNCPFGGSGANPGGVCASCGCVVKPGTATHSMTIYRASSGALVFGAGTVQWSWGLDGNHDNGPTKPDQSMRQATVNLFADMGIQPGSLQPGLVYATMSTDVIGPSSVITAPLSGANLQVGTPVTITGTASDTGGGRVGGVEVSVDGGKTWRRALGREVWSYTWIPTISGQILVQSRATDDSANIGNKSATVAVNVTLSPTSATGLVASYNFNAGSGSTLTDLSGLGNHGTISNATWTAGGHAGSALSFNGTNSSVTIASSSSLNLSTGMTLEAWIRPTDLSHSSAILVKEGNGVAPYILYSSDPTLPSVFLNANSTSELSAPSYQSLIANTWNHVAASFDGAFLRLYVNGIFVSQANSSSGILSSNGVLRIGGTSIFGSEFFSGLIDDVRIYNRSLSQAEIQADMSTPVGGAMDSTPPSASISSPTPNSSLTGSRTIVANVSDAIGVAGVQFLLNGTPLGLEDVAVPFSMSWDTTKVTNGNYVLSLRVRDMAGNFTTSAGVNVTVSNPTDLVAPTVRLTSPFASRTVGGQFVLAAFAADNVGVTGVQFKANGNNLGPVDTTAPYRILASLAPGTYTITATATDVRGNQTTSNTITLTVDGVAPTVTSRSPAPGASGVPTDSPILVTFNEPVQTNPSYISVSGPNGAVAGGVSYDATTNTLIFAQSSPLSPSTTYTVTLNGVTDRYGNTLPTVSWSFSTSNVLRASLWGGATIPDVASDIDKSPIEVGMKFTSTLAGFITGVRFYKGVANTGTHVAHLWRSNGTLLASATFIDESPSGWQQVLFASPIAINANTTYVVSYLAPVGRYSYDSGYFASSGYSNGNLQALSSPSSGGNGVYTYTSSGAFPNNSFYATNYWVDPLFSTSSDPSAPTVISESPVPNATAVSIDTVITATFSEVIQPGTIVMTVAGPGGNVAGALSYNNATRTATFAPSVPLAFQSTYTVNISGAKDTANNVMASVSWSFTTAVQSAANSLWDNSVIPAVASTTDTGAVEVGLKFTSDTAGSITGVRFYKGPSNTGTHVAHLWSASGTLLASATFIDETATGWQQVSFASPVAIAANTTYVVSYFAPVGGYALNQNYFTTQGVDNGFLHAPSSASSGGNGVYRYGASSGFPTSTFQGSNYWVDPVFSTSVADTTPPTVVSRSPASNATGVSVGTSVSATFSEALQAGTVVMTLTGPGGAVAGSLSYNNATNTATFTPSAPLAAQTTYTVNVSGARDPANNVMASVSWSFTTGTTSTTSSLWSNSVIPAVASTTDTGAVELGLKFTSDTAGSITGVRFYKGPSNTGTHVAHLWSASGTLLASATFIDETATGWQQVSFASPVAIAANTTYVVSYFAPVGGYALNQNYFTSQGVDNGVLHAPSSASSGGNGVYRYGASSGFPTSTFQGSNYWVDPVFSTSVADTTPPTVVSRSPASNATGVGLGTSVSATLSETLQAGTVVMTLTGPGGAVAGSLSYNNATNTATFTPSAPLAAQTTYTVNVSGARDPANNVMASVSWSFTTGTTSTTSSLWSNSVIPAVASTTDTGAVELGLKFTSDTAGSITGVRFYKGPSNTGTHVAHLWSASGTLLASATFIDETATGWQQVSFASPVAIAANTTYVVSYFAPVGGYALNQNYFTTQGVDNGFLHAPSSASSGGNGVYRYGASSGFPTSTFQGSNYWVDPVFSTSVADTTPPTVVSRSPASNATGVSVGTSVSATFSEALQVGTASMTVVGPAGAVAGTVSYNNSTNTILFIPVAPFASQTLYTVNVSGARDLANNVMASISWTFTTG